MNATIYIAHPSNGNGINAIPHSASPSVMNLLLDAFLLTIPPSLSRHNKHDGEYGPFEGVSPLYRVLVRNRNNFLMLIKSLNPMKSMETRTWIDPLGGIDIMLQMRLLF